MYAPSTSSVSSELLFLTKLMKQEDSRDNEDTNENAIK